MAESTTTSRKEIPSMMGKFGGGNRFNSTQKPKNAKGTFFRLFKIFMIQRYTFLLAILLTIISSLASLAVPYFIGRAINTFDIKLSRVDQTALFSVLAMLLAAYLVSYLIETFNGVIMARVSQRLIKFLRTQFFAKLQRLPLNFFDTTPNGDTMSRLTNDIDNVSGTIAQITTQLVFSVISIAGATVMMVILSPILTLVALTTIPLVVILTKSISKKSRQYFSGQQRSLGQLNGIIEESIVGLKMVKAFNQQDHTLESFVKTNQILRDYSVKAHRWSGFLMPLMNVINNLGFTFVAAAGGILSVSGGVSVGTVVSFISYSRQFGQPLNNIAGMFNTIQSALAGAERVFQILDSAEEVSDKENAVDLTDVRGDVEFRDVCFSYTPTAKILEDVSFSVKAGEVVALVGETGAGKTTIVNLLTRFYEVESGRILIDGIDITDIKKDSLRRMFSVVLQDTCLFTGSIADNIRYSNATATDEEVVAAAKLAYAHEFIKKLPSGYDTIVSGSTDTLSQGQRQLLAIARAMLSKAPILILDEATSSVDTRTEKNIQRAMIKLMDSRTCFMIAHRLSTIRDANTIMVVSDRHITEAGTHDELMLQKGQYHDMVVSQMGLVV